MRKKSQQLTLSRKSFKIHLKGCDSMSKVEAAYVILKRYNRPMKYHEIIEIALKENMIQTKGLTPAQTLRVDVINENRRRKNRGEPTRFNTSTKGYVSLNQ